MTIYTLTAGQSVNREDERGACSIPFDKANTDYQAYLAWLGFGFGRGAFGGVGLWRGQRVCQEGEDQGEAIAVVVAMAVHGWRLLWLLFLKGGASVAVCPFQAS